MPLTHLPVGSVIWLDDIANVPVTDWHVCDGTAGTLDLQDLFVVGAGSSYDPYDTGGDTTLALDHTHDLETLYSSGTPQSGFGSKSAYFASSSHHHTASITTSAVAATGGAVFGGISSISYDTTGSHTHSGTVDPGPPVDGLVGDAHEATGTSTAWSPGLSRLPPTIALFAIQRIS